MNDLYLQQVETRARPHAAGVVQRRRTDFGPLSGRISIQGDRPGEVKNYYIGPMHINQDDLFVISWAAPAAAVFFKNLSTWDSKPVRVRRRFVQQVRKLTNYADVWVGRPSGEPFPLSSAKAEQPSRPAKTSSWLSEAKARARVNTTKSTDSVPVEAAPRIPAQQEAPVATMEDLLRDTLASPRSGGLTSVLSTLQADQYDLVTYSEDRSLVVQGHAGTGKTIVATHRAAWLVDENRTHALGAVLLLGPTPAWEAHVSSAIGELGGADKNIAVSSLHSLILEILGFESEGVRLRPVDAIRVPTDADALVRKAALGARSSGSKGLNALEEFYHSFVTQLHLNGVSSEIKDWAGDLPSTFKGARRNPLLWPLLAYMYVLIEPGDVFEHVIIDEAQDLSLFEWRVLEEMNVGSWTLVGDMQQRHSQQVKSWSDVTSRITGTAWDERVMNDGYRTSQAIAEFAARLLPKSAGLRRASPLGRGIPPRVINAADLRRTVEAIALEQCRRLSLDHPGGTIAVITPPIERVLREARISGWTAEDRWTWADTDLHRCSFLTPEEARGLEFDAVVVVEPSTFRANSGSDGRLYTSLTRANLELVVVHSGSMPAALMKESARLARESFVQL
ncbi:AAA family ATPase [Arthrobacter sedimenti]|uniref:AAA family ATPase n=1 Tax=Arthrobacter sedimenti TaxID=2694931 RepID=UPI000B354676|nr:AAA family ATPase [Arthrobacter sedimenti]